MAGGDGNRAKTGSASVISALAIVCYNFKAVSHESRCLSEELKGLM